MLVLVPLVLVQVAGFKSKMSASRAAMKASLKNEKATLDGGEPLARELRVAAPCDGARAS